MLFGRYLKGEVSPRGGHPPTLTLLGGIMHIDEHVLAGFMAGELNESERTSVTTALLKDRGMREWLSMASEALAAAKAGEKDGLMSRFMPKMNESRPGICREDRHAIPGAFRTRRVG